MIIAYLHLICLKIYLLLLKNISSKEPYGYESREVIVWFLVYNTEIVNGRKEKT